MHESQKTCKRTSVQALIFRANLHFATEAKLNERVRKALGSSFFFIRVRDSLVADICGLAALRLGVRGGLSAAGSG